MNPDGTLKTDAVALVEYGYDGDGNLTTVTKLVKPQEEPERGGKRKHDVSFIMARNQSDVRNFRVRPEDHFVVEIKDDRGLKPIQYVYDDQGRLVETIDAQDKSIKFDP